MSLYYSPYHNCKRLILTAMLLRDGINESIMWNKIGFHFNEYFDKYVYPYPITIEEELKSLGYDYKHLSLYSYNDFESKISKILKSNKTVAIYVDIFELNYTIYFKKQHHKHSVEIWKVDEENYYIYDHYYQFEGSISKESLKSAVYSLDSQKFTLFFLNKTKHFPDSNVLKFNSKSLSGDLSYSCQNKYSIVGIFGIKDFINKILNDFSNEELYLKNQYFKNYYPVLKELSYSRYHFSKYLEYEGFEEISDVYLDVSQNWSIVANILLIGNVSQNYKKILPRITRILESTFQKEKLALELLNSIINR